MKRICLDQADIVNRGDRFVMLDGVQVAEVLSDKWFKFQVIIMERYDLETRIEIVYHGEVFYVPIIPVNFKTYNTIECIGSCGSRMVLWFPSGSSRMAVSIYGKRENEL